VRVILQECPIGTYKDVDGSEEDLCIPCPLDLLPNRANFIYKRGIFDDITWLYMPNVVLYLKFLGWFFSFQGVLQNGLVHINAYQTNIECRIAIHL